MILHDLFFTFTIFHNKVLHFFLTFNFARLRNEDIMVE